MTETNDLLAAFKSLTGQEREERLERQAKAYELQQGLQRRLKVAEMLNRPMKGLTQAYCDRFMEGVEAVQREQELR